MVDALGVMGYEGIYRKTCEVTLKVLRNEYDSLINVLRPFIYDPVADWLDDEKLARHNSKNNALRGNNEGDETKNAIALQIVEDVSRRLQGKVYFFFNFYAFFSR